MKNIQFSSLKLCFFVLLFKCSLAWTTDQLSLVPLENRNKKACLSPEMIDEFHGALRDCVSTYCDLQTTLSLSKTSKGMRGYFWTNSVLKAAGLELLYIKQRLLSPFPEALQNFPLKLQCENLLDCDLQYIANATNVSLCYCWRLTDLGIQYLKNLESLHLSYCDQITDKGIQSVKHLKKLTILGCGSITENALQGFENLSELILRWNRGISDETLQYLENLTTLFVSYCDYQLTYAGFANLKNLTKLSLSNYKEFTVEDLQKKLPNLKEIKLKNIS